MDINDPEYSIVVSMAEILVPDICRLVMEFLERIHVELEKEKWKIGINAINKEYKKTWKEYDENLVLLKFSRGRRPVCNYRILTEKLRDWGPEFISHFSPGNPWTIHPVAMLSENYVYARLYKD